jgi:hypothetical protein
MPCLWLAPAAFYQGTLLDQRLSRVEAHDLLWADLNLGSGGLVCEVLMDEQIHERFTHRKIVRRSRCRFQTIKRYVTIRGCDLIGMTRPRR